MINAPISPVSRPLPTLSAAHLRAFIHAHSMKPGRPDLLDYSAEDIAQAMARLPSEDAARALALLPAGMQIAVAIRLSSALRARLARESAEWCTSVPILRSFRESVAQASMAGQMAPNGRR